MQDEKINPKLKRRGTWIGTSYLRAILFHDLLKPDLPENEGYNKAIWDMISFLNVYDRARIEQEQREIKEVSHGKDE